MPPRKNRRSHKRQNAGTIRTRSQTKQNIDGSKEDPRTRAILDMADQLNFHTNNLRRAIAAAAVRALGKEADELVQIAEVDAGEAPHTAVPVMIRRLQSGIDMLRPAIAKAKAMLIGNLADDSEEEGGEDNAS
ncbi:hypothetical protein OCU04_008430 [Sclerotinia nivalis]|uniref:Uncharacterized protein n=1 Tax=Sclerotinia nivalis TaxID=352851 RepID=A0A9X0AI21_9HELO|nr:hypothetical protein OCU04_008430 [Sclerotinia nivalis]